jgi:hypothetical protein
MLRKRDLNPRSLKTASVLILSQFSQPPAVKWDWSKERRGPRNMPSRFESYVRMKGGEFFFAPSITFLRGL